MYYQSGIISVKSLWLPYERGIVINPDIIYKETAWIYKDSKGETLNSNLDQPYLNQPSEFPKTRYNRSVSEKPLSDSILCYRHCYVFEKPILFSFTYTAKLYFPVSQKYVGAMWLSIDESEGSQK